MTQADRTAGAGLVSPADLRRTSPLSAPAARLLRRVVETGGAIGWVDPPGLVELESALDLVGRAALSGDAHAAALVDGPDVVALGYWQRYARPSNRLNADVQKVVVAPDRRGAGLASRVMAELIDRARCRGVERLTLDVRGDNTGAIALYESLGFTRYGSLRDFIAVGGARYDKLFYVLDLRAEPPPGG